MSNDKEPIYHYHFYVFPADFLTDFANPCIFVVGKRDGVFQIISDNGIMNGSSYLPS